MKFPGDLGYLLRKVWWNKCYLHGEEVSADNGDDADRRVYDGDVQRVLEACLY